MPHYVLKVLLANDISFVLLYYAEEKFLYKIDLFSCMVAILDFKMAAILFLIC